MKRILLPTVFFAFLFSQKTNAQKVGFGFNAGLTMAQVKTKTDNTTDNTGWHPGFCAGITADIPMGGQFSFQPAFNFLQKGGQSTETYNGETAKYSAILNYLEIPINIVYRSKGTKGHFIAGMGPSLAYCLSGKSKGSYGGQSVSNDLKIGNSEDDDLKPFELGGNLLAGYESGAGLVITFNYNMGFTNLSTDDQSSLKNNYFGLKLGYSIPHKK